MQITEFLPHDIALFSLCIAFIKIKSKDLQYPLMRTVQQSFMF